MEYLRKLLCQRLLGLQMLRGSKVRAGEGGQQMENTLFQLSTEVIELPQLLHEWSHSPPRTHLVLFTGALANGLWWVGQGGVEQGQGKRVVAEYEASEVG